MESVKKNIDSNYIIFILSMLGMRICIHAVYAWCVIFVRSHCFVCFCGIATNTLTVCRVNAIHNRCLRMWSSAYYF